MPVTKKVNVKFIDVRPQLQGLDDEDAIRKRADWFKMLVERGIKNPDVREKALDLVRDLKERDYLSELKAIWRYTRDHIRYVHDPLDADLYNDASVTMRLKQGDCDDKSILFCSLAKSIGHPCGFYFMSQGLRYTHVMPYAITPTGHKIYFETTIRKPFNWKPMATKFYEELA